MNILCKLRNKKTNSFFILKQFLCKNTEKLNDVTKESGCKEISSVECKNEISVGIVGGGMTLIYTAVLLKQLKSIRAINIVDTSELLGAAAFDASHIDTKAKIKYYRKNLFKEALSKVIKNVSSFCRIFRNLREIKKFLYRPFFMEEHENQVNIIALMDDGDGKILSAEPKIQLMMSSNYVHDIIERISKVNSTALLAIFVRPVTATLPLVSEIFRRKKCWDPNRIIGSVALDVMRIESMAAELFHLNPAFLSIPVVGGADPTTIVPLLSKARPLNYISKEHEKLLINRLKCCDKELENYTDDYKSPAMSSGAAAAKFISKMVRALSGEPNVMCCAYVRSNVMPFCPYFANEIELGTEGIKNNFGLPKVSPMAVDLIQRAIPLINELSEIACKSLEDENKVSVDNKI